MLRDKANLALIAAIAIALCGILVYPPATVVKAQESTAINIVAKTTGAPVTSITFPEGSPGATVSNPYNDVDTSSDPQFLDSSASEPVVRLYNTAGETLTVWLLTDNWTNNVIASERYELVGTDNLTINAVTRVLSADGASANITTGENITAGGYKALYLEVTLGAGYGRSGTSTLTILGEN